MKNITSDTLYLLTYLLFHSNFRVQLRLPCCFDGGNERLCQCAAVVLKNVRDMFPIIMNVFHSLQLSTTSALPTHIFFNIVFFAGSTHRPLAPLLVSLPEMQPCFSLPISHLGFLTLRWCRAPNKIWVRLESPNIRIQYRSHKRLQAPNWHSNSVFFWRFDQGRLAVLTPIRPVLFIRTFFQST